MTRHHPDIIPASKDLQTRIGTGTIDQAAIKRSEQAMILHRPDFIKVAAPILNSLRRSLKQINPHDRTSLLPTLLIEPIIDLKGMGRMFGYDLVTDLANVMLAFLDVIPHLDADVMELLYAHERTLRALVNRKMNGHGGASGTTLVRELKEACNRYLRQQKLPPLVVGAV